MAGPLVSPGESLERQNEKLRKITAALMRRVEQESEAGDPSYFHTQTAMALEAQIRARTRDLEETLELLNQSNARLSAAKLEAERARADLANALEAVHEGFALFDSEDNLVMRNSRFSISLPDVRERMAPGLHFTTYVHIVAESPCLVLPEGMTRAMWAERRARAHQQRHVNFNVELTGDRWIQVSEQRTPDNGTAILQTDVTEMIRLERQERDKLLDDQSRLVRATLDHINQGVGIFDRRHRMVGWNDRLRELMQPPPRLLRMGISFEAIAAFFSTDQALRGEADPERLLEWVRRPPGRPPLKLELHRANGLILDVFCQETPQAGFVISFTDVTAERQAVAAIHLANETLEARVLARTEELSAARDEAERANASKSRFVAAASHDLLQPLNAAKLFIASLGETALDARQQAITGRIENAFESVETILGALLDISKLDAGAATTDISSFPLDRLLRPLAEEFRETAARKGLDLRVVPCSVPVESDPSYLRRILQNLVSNALRYTRTGKVLVGARREGRSLRIEVRDTGPGIPPDKTREVFQEFQRLDTSPGAPPGMGLGLAIVERACTLLGHGLTLTSIEGRGTCFAVTVPLGHAATAQDGAQEHGPGPLAADLTDMMALIVENDAEIRVAMMTMLENWGVSPFDAANAEEALAAVTDLGLAPDVILADYHLDNDETGLDVILALRACYGHVPAVLITADRSEELRALATGTNTLLLHKPLQPQTLRSILAWIQASRLAVEAAAG
ncbi:response regulator (plasmid) [Paroceanicella profunda]|uniref:histidine kinase n=1 Tax=Paroceanicella profunda TaxID=2579971 RepID=A0A5B8FIJ9_9RHOB|nr:NahK/ErcS family hybrid sensor histidine kinase/response regulator [Paroceanicella profunda]QDL93891.1 response regulator [Paroceanicella profunda]